MSKIGLIDIPSWDEYVYKAVSEAFDEIVSDFELYPDKPEEFMDRVEHESRDGFIPHTNGGWEARAFSSLSYIFGTGKMPGDKKTDEYLNKLYNYSMDVAKEQFIDDNLDAVAAIYKSTDKKALFDKIDYNDLYEKKHGDLAEKLSEYESEATSDDQSSVMFHIGAFYYGPEPTFGKHYRPMKKGKETKMIYTPDPGKEHELYVFGAINWEAPYHRSGSNNESVILQDTITFKTLGGLKKQLPGLLKKLVKDMK